MARSAPSVSSSASRVHSAAEARAPIAATLTVSVVLVRVVVEVAERNGVTRDALLGPLAIDPAHLSGLDGRVELPQFQQLIARAIELTQDAAFGLHLATLSSQGGFDLVGQLMFHAATLREALAVCRHFLPLFLDGVELSVDENATRARIRCSLPRTCTPLDITLAELAVAGFCRMLHDFGAERAQGVYFEHPRPAQSSHHAEYFRLFGGAARFNQRFTGIELRSELLDRPHLHSHPQLQSVLRREAEQSLDRLSRPSTFAERLAPLLLSAGGEEPLDMQTAARSLGMSMRTLRRRLADEGICYRDLAQRLLCDRARHLLSDPSVSVQQAAHALRFADVTAFHRAFKRWTGLTPSEFRTQPTLQAMD